MLQTKLLSHAIVVHTALDVSLSLAVILQVLWWSAAANVTDCVRFDLAMDGRFAILESLRN